MMDTFAHVLEAERQKRERFRDTVLDSQKAEFINGEVIVHSLAKKRHITVGKLLLKVLDTYVSLHDLGYVGHEKMMISLTRNDYEPDLCFFEQAKAEAFRPDQMLFPAPDFIAEILSPSTEHVDRGIKYDDYAAHSITEYWLIDPKAEIIEQYLLHGDQYELVLKSGSGEIKSVAVEGFMIPIRALFDERENLRILQKFFEPA